MDNKGLWVGGGVAILAIVALLSVSIINKPAPISVSVNGGQTPVVTSGGQPVPEEFGGTTHLSGLAISGAFSVTGNETVGGTFGVTGATTLSSTLGVAGILNASSTLNVTGAQRNYSTIRVDGAATLSSTLGVTGKSTLGNVSSTAETISSYLVVGSGSPVDLVRTGTVTKDFVSLAGGACTTTSATVTGATAGDTVLLSVPLNVMGVSTSTGDRAGIEWTGVVSSANTVLINGCNTSSTKASSDFPSGTFRASVISF